MFDYARGAVSGTKTLGDAGTKVDASSTLSQELSLRVGMTNPAGIWEGYRPLVKISIG